MLQFRSATFRDFLSAPDSRIKVLVIPTDEELEIAEATVKVVEKK